MAAEVDIFVPTIDEIQAMLHPGSVDDIDDRAYVGRLLDELADFGPALVGLKLGLRGLILKSANDRQRWATIGSRLGRDLDPWVGADVSAPTHRRPDGQPRAHQVDDRVSWLRIRFGLNRSDQCERRQGRHRGRFRCE